MNTATYSPEDNKLRLYPSERFPSEDLSRLKTAGFRWAPKQQLFVCPSWSPRAEDLLLENFVDEIDDEDVSPEERAADRAERFTGYRDKRATEAGVSADVFEDGPQAFGNQSARRAERLAARHDRHRIRAVSQWGKAEYWQMRTKGVIAHALHKANPAVRRSRILRLEAEQRKQLASLAAAKKTWSMWLQVQAQQDMYKAHQMALMLSNHFSSGFHYVHPRHAISSATSLYSLLTHEQDPITGHEAATLYFEHASDPNDQDSYGNRWARHYELRLTYERAMLENEGGSAAAVDMEVGGFIGDYQISRINRSPVTKAVVSVEVNSSGRRKRINVQRLGESVYRSPTEEEKAAFLAAMADEKKARKAAAPIEAKLINPTDEDAERLQAIWNAKAREIHAKQSRGSPFRDSEIVRVTQAQYSANSRGEYSRMQTTSVTEMLLARRTTARGQDCAGRHTVFKVRTATGGGWYDAAHVIVLTDKPRASIPWEDIAAIRAGEPQIDDVFPRWGEVIEACSNWRYWENEELRKLCQDCEYLGLVSAQSTTQLHMTAAGRDMTARWQAAQSGQESSVAVQS